jgi:hypothetical protein
MFLGLAIIYGVEYMVEYFENFENEDAEKSTQGQTGGAASPMKGPAPLQKSVSVKTFPKQLEWSDPEQGPVTKRTGSPSLTRSQSITVSGIAIYNPLSALVPATTTEEDPETQHIATPSTKPEVEWEDKGVELSERAISRTEHRKHIQEHLVEVSDILKSLDLLLVTLNTKNLSVDVAEQTAEKIDETLHTLQYRLDHCRR